MRGRLDLFPALQFIPARGRKLVFKFQTDWIQTHCNLSPRGDGNIAMQLSSFLDADIAIYPREGTETLADIAAVMGRDHCNLSPRGDGNGSIRFTRLHIVDDCNLSPRGDGNFYLYFNPPVIELQFIPARGRKRLPSSFNQLSTVGLQFIPARGRKPHRPWCSGFASRSHCNLSPRGDGNSCYNDGGCFGLAIAIYPREGTETY